MKLITVIGIIVVLIVFAAPVMARPNLAVNGINHVEPHPAGYEWVKFLNAANAEEVPGVYLEGGIFDIIDVGYATPVWDPILPPKLAIVYEGETRYLYWKSTENNGLVWFETHSPKHYDTVFAYSGGTRTVVTAILADYLECNRLVLISAQTGLSPNWKKEIEYIKSRHPSMEIIIYQSISDLPTGIFFSSSDNAWLIANNIKVNPGIPEFGNLDPLEVNQRKIIINDDINYLTLDTVEAHLRLFNYISGKLRSNDIIFLIDTTGSMWDDIETVKSNAVTTVDIIPTDSSNPYYRNRVAIADYRDWPIYPYGGPGDYPYHPVLPFTTDKPAIINAINSLSIGNGEDWEESVYKASIQAINTVGLDESTKAPGWQGGTKNLILMGDAPSHSPDPVSGDTSSSVKAASDAVDPVRIFSIAIGGDPTTLAQFTELSEETGGKAFSVVDPAELVEVITEVISDISEPENLPPDTSWAVASKSNIWPPNHKMVPISILNVVDPDGDPVTITITGITQDEKVTGLSKEDLAPDGSGIGLNSASIRAERWDRGDGRVYKISFNAIDNKGASAPGFVFVGVPHDQGKNKIIIDSGQNYDSTQK